LCVHWFNPLCWLAFNRMSLDMELSCDERVLKQFGDENMKKKYSKTLLDFATDNRYPTPAPISFSEGAGAKTRIKHALYWKKPRFWVSAIALLLCAVVLVACAANAVSEDPSDDTSGEKRPDRLIDFGDTPYQFTFTSNGDGTCVITDIQTDFDHTEPFDLVIPEKSPDGDKVVEVDMSVLDSYKDVFNVPGALTKETFSSIIGSIRTSEFKEENSVNADIVDSFYGRPHGQPSAEHVDEFSYVILEPYISVEEASRISEILTDFIGYTAKDCYTDCLAVLELDTSQEIAAVLKENAFRFFYHDVSNIGKVILPNKDVNVNRGNWDTAFALPDGTAFEPAYNNPVSIGYLTDDVDLFSPDTLHFAEKQTDTSETIMLTASETVAALCFFELDSTDGETFSIEKFLFSGAALTNAQTMVIDTYISETFPNRGIGFYGSDSKMHYYAINWSGYDGSLSLSEITDRVDVPLSLSIREATEEDKHNENYLHFVSPGLTVSHDLVITTNQTLTGLNVCKFEASDDSDENGRLYTAEPFDTHLGVFSPASPLHLTVYPESITSTYGIFFREKSGTLRYFAIFENEFDGAISLVEITDRILLPQFPGETVIATHAFRGGTLYHTKRSSDDKQALRILYEDGTSKEFKILFSNIANIKLNQAENKLIWNDFPGEYCSFWIYDIAGDIVTQCTVGVDYTPSYMDWFDDRYFLFVRQSTTSSAVRGGDVYVCDTTDRNNYLLFDAETEGANEVMISSFAFNGNNLTLVGYVYNHETTQYTDWSYTLTTDAVQDLIANHENVTLKVEKEIPPLPSPLYGETLIEFYRFENGYIFLTYNEERDLKILRAMYDGGGVDYIHEDECFAYLGYNATTQQLIWSDYGKNSKSRVYLYDARIDKLYKNITGNTDVEYSVTFLKWFDDQHFLYAREPVQGSSMGDGDMSLYDAQGFGYYPIVDAQNNLVITRYDNGRIYAKNTEDDGTQTELFYMLSEAEITEMIGIESKWRTLRADDCIAMLDSPVNVVPTDKQPSIKFDGDVAEVFEFTFTKDVKGFAIVKIDTGVAYDVTVDPLGEPTDYKAGDTLVYSMYINDIGDSRGFVLIGEDGKLHYYALRGPDMAGFSSDYSVVEVTDHPLLTVDGKTPDFNP
ncbi:MAG: hypothetical protein IJB88_03735, partial [Clostridia bacterium]|nr:hypothetical protein [Clostridia bacterium]